jgi:hypothetical protein
VNDTDVKQMFAAAVARPAVDRIDTDAVLRGGRRRRRLRNGATVGSVAVALALVASVAFAARPTSPSPTVVAGSSTLTVSCAYSGIAVSNTAVAATSAGVVVTVSSTMPGDTYLNYLWPGGGGGDPIPAGTTTWTIQAPPGPLTLSCGPLSDATGARTTVTVTDAKGYWRAATLADLGCGMGGMLDWGGTPGRGPTPQAAVEALLPRFSPSQKLSAVPAAVGYPDGPAQTWIASTGDGKPYLAVAVTKDGSEFVASPNSYCTR